MSNDALNDSNVDEAEKTPSEKDPNEKSNFEYKVCPYCAEQIKTRAIKCRYCQSDLRSYIETGMIQPDPFSVRNKFGCGLALLGFILPPIGLVTGAVWLTSAEDRDRAWLMISVSLLGLSFWSYLI